MHYNSIRNEKSHLNLWYLIEIVHRNEIYLNLSIDPAEQVHKVADGYIKSFRIYSHNATTANRKRQTSMLRAMLKYRRGGDENT